MTEPEIQVIACRWVDEGKMDALASLLPPGVVTPPIYPGSTQGRCQSCTEPVWIGPRAQEHLEAASGVLPVVACFPCAARLVREYSPDDPPEVRSLGNPYLPATARSTPRPAGDA